MLVWNESVNQSLEKITKLVKETICLLCYLWKGCGWGHHPEVSSLYQEKKSGKQGRLSQMAQVSSTSIDSFSSLSQVFNGSLSPISSCWRHFLSATLYTLQLYLEDRISKRFVLHVCFCLFFGRCQLCSTDPRWPPVLPCVPETKYASSLLRVCFLSFKKFKLLHPATLILPIKAK